MTTSDFVILAHRGLWDHHPENSIGAIAAALDQNFGLEIDVRITSDGIPVLIHDQNTHRLTGNRLAVSESTFEKLTSLKFNNSDEKIATLSDALNLAATRNTEIALHLKDIQSRNVAELVLNAIPPEALNNTFVFDVPISLGRRFKELEPRLRIGVSVGDKKYHQYFYDLEDLSDGAVDIVWADEYRNLYNKEFFQKIREIGMTSYVVSPDIASLVGHPLAHAGYEDTWENVLMWGASGVCTDKPRELLSLISENN